DWPGRYRPRRAAGPKTDDHRGAGRSDTAEKAPPSRPVPADTGRWRAWTPPRPRRRPARKNRSIRTPRATTRTGAISTGGPACTPAQQRSWDELWDRVGKDAADEMIDPASWFGRTAPLVVEIGAGTGTSTAAMALAEPEIDVIAVEVYHPGLAQLLHAINREQIPNIRLVRGDGVDVLENMIAPASLTGVRVF